MVRPRVSEENRQRVANACDECKRRKSKCDDRNPCEKCLRRNSPCIYTLPKPIRERGSGPDGLQEPAPKRRHVKDERFSPPAKTDSPSFPRPTPWDKVVLNESEESQSLQRPSVARTTSPAAAPGFRSPEEAVSISPGSSIASGPNEEAAKPQNGSRMLCHPTGRLLFLGDSASLSFLQLVRMICSNWMNDQVTPFTHDEKRHSILENMENKAPADLRPPHVLSLPNRHATNVLIDSYFANTSGMVALLDRHEFANFVDTCYVDPLATSPSSLCLLYLVLAIGLVLAAPLPGSEEEAVIQHLRHPDFDRAEAFFQSARRTRDPLTDIDDSEFESVQALTLMSLYMLAVSRRNAAYTFLGPAVRLAFSLGLHRGWETRGNFYGSQWRYLMLRKNVFRTIYLLDRFLSALLGRPTAIADEDLSHDALDNPRDIRPPSFHIAPGASSATFMSPNCGGGNKDLEPSPMQAPMQATTALTANPEAAADCPTTFSSRRGSLGISQDVDSSGAGLDSAVRSARAIGDILKHIYSQRDVSTKLARDIAKAYRMSEADLDKALPKSVLRDKKAVSATPEKAMETMHVWLFHYHYVILLSRPFFLHLFITMFNSTRPPSMAATSERSFVHTDRKPNDAFSPRSTSSKSQMAGRVGRKMERFSEACLQASICSIDLIHVVFRSDRLARRNPFVIYFLFVAALVLLANEFASLYDNPHYNTTIAKVKTIIDDFARTDPQARRLRYIINEFSFIIGKRQGYPGYPTTLPPPHFMSDREPSALILNPEPRAYRDGGSAVGMARSRTQMADSLGTSPEKMRTPSLSTSSQDRRPEQGIAGEVASGMAPLGVPGESTSDEATLQFSTLWVLPGPPDQALRLGSSRSSALPGSSQNSPLATPQGSAELGNAETRASELRMTGDTRHIELYRQGKF